MRRSAFLLAFPWSLTLVLTQTGCQTAATAGLSVLNLIGLAEKPLVVMHAAERTGSPEGPLEVLDPFAPFAKLNQAMGKAVKRSVVPDMCFSFQVEPNLTLGMGHIAVVTPLQYGRMKDRAKYPVLAVSIDEHGRVERPALLVAATTSPIQKVEDLRGKTVAFGSSRDSRRHHAALALLKEHGLSPTDLSLELFPVPGSLKTFAKSRDVMQSVINASSDAGFVDQEDWDNLPERHRDDEPGRDKLRVIAETIPVAERLVLRAPAPMLDDATASAVQEFLLSVDKSAPDALKPLRIGGFREASPEVLAACVRLAETAAPSQATRPPATADGSEP
jgi:ABC-type phosphate/phosphonate transport system substrate-binding protein